MRALITGVGGFVGPHLVELLRRRTDWSLFGLCRHPVEGGGYTPIVADLLDRVATARAVADVRPTHVFHLAAQSHVPTSLDDAGATIANNTLGQINLLDACRALDIPPRVLVVGSAEEYGLARPEEMPLAEDQPFRPTNPYAVSKVTQDLLGWQYFHTYGLPVVRVRPFNHTGPGQSDRFAIGAFARQIAEIEVGRLAPVVRVGNLEARRDFLDVRDVVVAYHLALTRGEPGAVYNIGSGTAVRLRDALDLLIGCAKVRLEVVTESTKLRPADIPLLVADCRALSAATGWAPAIPLERSLRDTLDWWRGQVAASAGPALAGAPGTA